MIFLIFFPPRTRTRTHDPHPRPTTFSRDPRHLATLMIIFFGFCELLRFLHDNAMEDIKIKSVYLKHSATKSIL